MKIYLPTWIAVSVVAISATTALSMQTTSLNQVSSSQKIVTLSESTLDSQKIESLSFSRSQEDRFLGLYLKTNSFFLDAKDIPASDLTVRSTNFGQPIYAVTIPIIKF